MAKLPSLLKTQLNRFYFGITDALAPARCVQCLRESSWLCGDCQANLTITVPLSCIGCATASPRGTVCSRCQPDYVLQGVLYAGSYGSPWLKRGIHWLKFKGVRSVAPELSRLLIPRLTMIAPLAQLREQAQLVPIPLHRQRLRQRGFNQSTDLALALSELTGIPTDEALIRRRSTWAQAKLPHELRQENIADAFRIRAGSTSSPIAIIVDDVTTSGATLNTAAKVLAAAGTQHCWGLTLARG